MIKSESNRKYVNDGQDDIYNYGMTEEEEEESEDVKHSKSSGTQVDPNEPLNDLDGLKD